MSATSWVTRATGLAGLVSIAAALAIPATGAVAAGPPVASTVTPDLPPRVVIPGPVLRLEPRVTSWVLPVESYRLTARFGASASLWASGHTGLDFAAPSGTPVRAVTSGTVTSAAYDGAYGLRTIVTAPDGTEVWSCHLGSQSVSVGERVDAGEVLGTVGTTGNVTGAHLHLEVRPAGGDPVDPEAALAVHGVRP